MTNDISTLWIGSHTTVQMRLHTYLQIVFVCCRWVHVTVRAHNRLRAGLDQFPLHRCAPAEKQIVEMEPNNRCLHLITKNRGLYWIFSPSNDKDFSLQNDGVSVRKTEGWHARPLLQTRYMARRHELWICPFLSLIRGRVIVEPCEVYGTMGCVYRGCSRDAIFCERFAGFLRYSNWYERFSTI